MFFKIGHLALLAFLSCAFGMGFTALVIWLAEKRSNLAVIFMFVCASTAIVAYCLGWYQKFYKRNNT